MCQKFGPAEKQQLTDALKQAFNEIDLDRSGYIDSKEFENVARKYNCSTECQTKMTDAQIKETAAKFVQFADENHDGKVSFPEFLDFFLNALGLKELYQNA